MRPILRRFTSNLSSELITAVFAAAAVLGGTVADAGVLGPGPNTTSIPSTAQTLSIAITSPADGSTAPFPGPFTLSNCSIDSPAGDRINLLYVLDLSGSTAGRAARVEASPMSQRDGQCHALHLGGWTKTEH